MQTLTGVSAGMSGPAISAYERPSELYQPSNVVDGPRVTVTGHRTDSFSGFDGLMFQAMFEMPFGAGLRPDENHDNEQPIGPDDPIVPLPVNAELIVQTSEFYQTLPAEAQQALMSSPTLINQLATFILAGGIVRFDALDNGTAGDF